MLTDDWSFRLCLLTGRRVDGFQFQPCADCAFAFAPIGCRPVEVGITEGKGSNSAILDVRYVLQVRAGRVAVACGMRLCNTCLTV